MRRLRYLIGWLALSFPMWLSAAPGDFLYVTGDRVNARDGPDAGHAVLTRLTRHVQVVEISRQGGWVEVGVLSICRIAWVHQDYLVKNLKISGLQ